ncbi:Gfo/Idh/MocA family protein [Maribellus maritimus]|uniref:Gfo/Idh/MocA family protein n=1 Tax=Maribellus maritimus TaxID=2870838 RepID=UPI001EEBA60B|nr:Gfo/Idh/MocA family oxidoreductase [Maribellus maritimus]MCG6189314.1 Gfo/Idh/MocA family oxidoreductase [Maribellus maritimus]
MDKEEKQTTTTRRKFIKTASAVSAGFMILPRCTIGGKGFVPPSDKVNIALIGAGDISMHHLNEVFKYDDVQIISVADPVNYSDNKRLNKKDSGREPRKKLIEEHYAQKTPNYTITEYEDFRVMLEKNKAIDAVICCTPDHTHAYVSLFSMRAGKHVYCQKPLTHNIWEARKVREVAKETGLATQMGNQLHALDSIRQTVEYLRSGVIGKVHEAYSWVGATRYLKGLTGYPPQEMKVPRGFNWDLWVGPAAFRPYNNAYAPFTWRDFWVFGNGALGDFGCHDMDAATWAFDLEAPESVQVFPAGNRGSNEITPYGEIGHFYFAERGDQPPLKLTWLSGGLLPEHPAVLPRNVRLKSRGAMFIGEKGIILTNGGASGSPEIYPESLRESFTPPPPSLPRSKGHHREWIDAIKGGPEPLSNFEYASRLTEITLLGVLSLRMGGERIYWDSKNMKAVGLPDADQIIREPVRQGWEMS